MKSKMLLTSLVYSLIAALMLIQTNVVLAIAADSDNPITAAITSAIDNITNPSPTPSPTALPSVSPSSTPIPTSQPATNFISVNLLPSAESLTPAGNGTLTVTLTEKTLSGSFGVREKGNISGVFNNLTPNTLYTIWLVTGNFQGYDPIRSDSLLSDQNGNISFFTINFDIYHRTDQPVRFINLALSSLDLTGNSNACSKYNPCLSSSITFPNVTTSPTPTPIAIPISTATPSATPTATSSATPISTPITGDPTCVDFILFQVCMQIPFLNPTPSPITAPIAIPTATPVATPSATPSATPNPTPTPQPVVTPVINSASPNPATLGTDVILTGSGFSNSTKLFIDGYYIESSNAFPYTVSQDSRSLTFILSSEVNYVAGQVVTISVQNDGVNSNEMLLTVAPSVIQNIPTVRSDQILVAPSVTLASDHPELVLASSNFNTFVTIPTSVTNPVLDFTNVLTTTTNSATAIYNNRLDISSATSIGNVNVQFPALTEIVGPADWNGRMSAPKTLAASQANIPAEAGKTNTIASVVEIGAGDTNLTFSKPVRILVPGQAGKLVGYQRNTNFYKITQNCSADTQTSANSLPDAGNCYISVGSDMVIWTKHFTKFVTYVQTTNASTSTSSGSNSSNSTTQAPICNDTNPKSAPKLISAKVTGRNEVTLSWEKAQDPVTYYLMTYGTKPGSQDYGNPNIGGRETTSYIVKGLQNGQTYYFKVRAGNNCMPGSFSNEISVKASGDNVSGPAKGFKAGVLSAEKQKASSEAELKFNPITQATPQRIIAEAGNLITKFVNFVVHFRLWLPKS